MGKKVDRILFEKIKRMTETQKITGFTNQTIAETFGVSLYTITKIKNVADFDGYVKQRE